MSTATSDSLFEINPTALRTPRAIVWGCNPSSTKGFTCLSISPASNTTDVVPSPTSLSCDIEISAKTRAAGCTISKSFMIVAPSLLMVTLVPSYMSLSMPRGPSVERTASTTAPQALMLLINLALPWDVSVPSLNKMMPGCWP